MDELEYDLTLRPSRFDEFVGQEKIKENLKIFIEAANRRKEALDHVLFYGPPGLGKTTLANIIAREMEANIKATSGPVLEKPADLVGILTNQREGDILFIDEIHRLRPIIEEFLYPAMEDYRVEIRLSDGPKAQTMTMNIERFTLVGATTRFGLLTAPMRARFGIVQRLNFYPPEDLAIIVRRSSEILGVETSVEGAEELAQRSRGTPRVANRLLRRVRDYAQVMSDGIVNQKTAVAALSRLEIDAIGLDEIDHKVLRTIIEKFCGGPVGLDTIAASISEEADTIMDVYEPYLLQLGFLERTPRGRLVTPLAYQHLGISNNRKKPPQPTLL